MKTSREVLKSKRKQHRTQGSGNHLHATEALITDDDIDSFFVQRQFGIDDPEVLFHTVWFLITLHFGHRARQARQLKLGDNALKVDDATQEEYLEWVTERRSKTRYGDENEQNRAFSPKAYVTGNQRWPALFSTLSFPLLESGWYKNSREFILSCHQPPLKARIWDLILGKANGKTLDRQVLIANLQKKHSSRRAARSSTIHLSLVPFWRILDSFLTIIWSAFFQRASNN